MRTFFYFAYGSNLLTTRLRARCPSARVIGPASAPDHRIAYDVRAADGSAKLGLRPRTGWRAHGLLWEIDAADRDGLARAEGLNYREVGDFRVWLADAEPREVVTWLPLRPSEPGRPWHWYRALAVAGAEEAGLPREALAPLATVEVDRDPDPDRSSFVAAREALALAGRLDLLSPDDGRPPGRG